MFISFCLKSCNKSNSCLQIILEIENDAQKRKKGTWCRVGCNRVSCIVMADWHGVWTCLCLCNSGPDHDIPDNISNKSKRTWLNPDVRKLKKRSRNGTRGTNRPSEWSSLLFLMTHSLQQDRRFSPRINIRKLDLEPNGLHWRNDGHRIQRTSLRIIFPPQYIRIEPRNWRWERPRYNIAKSDVRSFDSERGAKPKYPACEHCRYTNRPAEERHKYIAVQYLGWQAWKAENPNRVGRGGGRGHRAEWKCTSSWRILTCWNRQH